MRDNKRTIISIKEIIFIVLALIILAIAMNLFYTNDTSIQIAKDVADEENENQVLQTAEKEDLMKITSRSQTEIRSNENEEGQAYQEVEVSWEEPVYKTIDEVTISRDMDLTVSTGLSKDDFKELIGNVKADTSKFFYNNAETIYDLCEKYELNEIFFCGLISAESGWNIASNHRRTHNYISLMKNGKLISYNSVYEGLKVAAQKLHNNYLAVGGKFYHGKTLAGVKTCFCPSSTWVSLVYGRMQQII